MDFTTVTHPLYDVQLSLADKSALRLADVVEVVRCKDCKYYTTRNGGVCEEPYNGLMFAAKDSFCSYGERKETEGS